LESADQCPIDTVDSAVGTSSVSVGLDVLSRFT